MTDKKEVRINSHEPGEVDASKDVANSESLAITNELDEGQVKKDVPSEEVSISEAVVEPEKELSEEEKLRIQIAELEDRLLRALADFDNYKKRSIRQYSEVTRTANDKLLGEILEVADNFERALGHVDEATDVKVLKQGTRLIYGQIQDLLSRHGVTPIEALGRPFDPNLHEAMMRVESAEYEEGVVALEMGKGYMVGDCVLRHSKVGVSQGKKAPDEQEGREEQEE